MNNNSEDALINYDAKRHPTDIKERRIPTSSCNPYKGRPVPQIWMFFGKVPKGGGVISDPKNYIADFVGFKAVYFGRNFLKKSPKRGGEGEGHR